MKQSKQLIALIILVASGSAFAGYSEEVCPSVVVEDAAWAITESRYERMISDMSLEESVEHERPERLRRIKNRIEQYYGNRVHEMPLSDDNLAKTILWAAECTGNDYRVFTAVLEVESYICGDRTGPNGDSGCSMFTTPAVNVFRNQLQLPNRKSRGTDLGKQVYEELIEGCYEEYRKQRLPDHNAGMAKDFVKLYEGSTRSLKDTFINGTAIHADLLSGAIHLKLNSALAGGYWIPGKAPGGVNRYNGSKHAAAYSRRVNRQMDKIGFECFEDKFTPAVQFAYCLMGDSPEACLQEWSYYYEGIGFL